MEFVIGGDLKKRVVWLWSNQIEGAGLAAHHPSWSAIECLKQFFLSIIFDTPYRSCTLCRYFYKSAEWFFPDVGEEYNKAPCGALLYSSVSTSFIPYRNSTLYEFSIGCHYFYKIIDNLLTSISC